MLHYNQGYKINHLVILLKPVKLCLKETLFSPATGQKSQSPQNFDAWFYQNNLTSLVSCNFGSCAVFAVPIPEGSANTHQWRACLPILKNIPRVNRYMCNFIKIMLTTLQSCQFTQVSPPNHLWNAIVKHIPNTTIYKGI